MAEKKAGVLYLMKSKIKGLYKLGQSSRDKFKVRVAYLEANGYHNVGGLELFFAVEAFDHTKKEAVLKRVFNAYSVSNSEVFAFDNAEAIKSLMAYLGGKQIFSAGTKKVSGVTKASKAKTTAHGGRKIPNGEYHWVITPRGRGKPPKAHLKVQNGKFIVLKGSECLPLKTEKAPACIKKATIMNGILQEDVPCDSPSAAGMLVIGRAVNGWEAWADSRGKTLNNYRKKRK